MPINCEINTLKYIISTLVLKRCPDYIYIPPSSAFHNCGFIKRTKAENELLLAKESWVKKEFLSDGRTDKLSVARSVIEI